MARKKCSVSHCCCNKKIISKYGFAGKRGARGPAGPGSSLTVRDAAGTPHIVTGVKEIRFTDPNALVTDLGGGVCQVNFVPPATVWNDIQGLPWYVGGSESFRPQYTIEGNRISFRGLLYLPLDNGGALVNVSITNSYLPIASAVLHAGSVTVIANANNNNGTPQGRFMTSDVAGVKNFPANAIPVARDIVFSKVPCHRRYSIGVGGRVAVYRSFVDVRIGCNTSVYVDGSANVGSGCIMVFSPFNDEYDGSGTLPLGNDPLALGISRVANGVAAADYIASTDDNPFTVPSAGQNNPFVCNAHQITSLGGFIINLEGLSGYLN